jgi:hypothetical protein
MNYSATDCFETFPFPNANPRSETASLESAGGLLYHERAAFMVDTDQGLTRTYNALKDPSVTARSEHGDRILALRELHIDMDRAVLQAYAANTGDPSWTHIEVPPYAAPRTPAEKSCQQLFENHVLDRLFELNEIRATTH